MTALKQQKHFNIAIVGGGIAGLTLAIGLLRYNVPFRIYEAAVAFSEVGAGVAFSPNALRAMELLDPRIRAGFEKRATNNACADKCDTWFEHRFGMDITGRGKAGEKFYESKVGAAQGALHRAAFLDELVALMPKEVVSFNKKLYDIEETEAGVCLRFEDGSYAEASAVIGCDGVKSRVRRILLGEQDEAAYPQFTKKYAYRGLIPMNEAAAALGDDLARNSQMWHGHHGHLIAVPVGKGEFLNIVAYRTKHNGKWEDERWVVPSSKENMLQDFEAWGDQVKSILGLVKQPDLWALFDYPPAKTYYRGRTIAILGDAAHASTPHQASGAGMAVEDAYVLSTLLGSIDGSSKIEAAFYAYDSIRRGRTQKFVTTSRVAGEMYDFELDGIGDNLEAFRFNLGRRLKWIWEHKLEDDFGHALQALNDEQYF